MTDKQIRIECHGAAAIPLDDCLEFQGELKSLSKDNFGRLRKQILEHGFSEPCSIWKAPDGKSYLLNGHQRLRVLRHLVSQEGYVCPDIPVNYIDAKDQTEAKKKLLSLASQYGEVSDQGLYEFIAEAGLDWRDVVADFSFPEIDIDQFAMGFFGEDPTEISEKQIDEGACVDKQCPSCGFKLPQS